MSKTLENLTKAFIGESQARNRYTYYARVAQKEGFEQIAEIFLATAEQEKTHAKRIFEHIQELKDGQNEIIVEAACPTVYNTTKENLAAAIAGETYEYTEMYPGFSATAKEEGFAKIAARLASIAKAEEHHAERYLKLLALVESNTFFVRSEKVWWVCRECGYVYFGEQPPTECPSCDHPAGFYQVKSENY